MQPAYIRQPPNGTVLIVLGATIWIAVAIRTYHTAPKSEFLVYIAAINAFLLGWRIVSEWLSYWKWKRAWIKVYNEDPLVMSIRQEREWREKLMSIGR
jgi:hypothetical protein